MAKTATALAPRTSASSFSDILKTKRSDIERPAPQPVGDYLCAVMANPRRDKSKQKQTPFVEFSYKVLEALDSVDTDQLDEWLTNKKGEKKKLSEVLIKDTYYITEGSLWRLEDMLKACKLEDEDMSIDQAIEETAGCQLIVTMRHESNQDGSAVFARVASVAAVEE
jgi:hypothetical protein